MLVEALTTMPSCARAVSIATNPAIAAVIRKTEKQSFKVGSFLPCETKLGSFLTATSLPFAMLSCLIITPGVDQDNLNMSVAAL